ncbi:cell surface protein, partial [Mycobacterium tuberculosis]|nr:cell surface protein [Mycobacterium tuberculosis]
MKVKNTIAATSFAAAGLAALAVAVSPP